MSENKSSPSERQKIMTKVTVKAWTDPNYAKKLVEDGLSVLRSEGLEIPDGYDGKVVVHLDGEGVKNFVIPSPPSVLELKSSELLTLAAQRLEIQLELF